MGQTNQSSPAGTKERPCRPWRDLALRLDGLPSHKWLGYFQGRRYTVSPGVALGKRQKGELFEQVAMKLV